jgi:hypothetical protein
MNKGVATAGAIGLGAGLMYLMDPTRGGQRRALLRDKTTSWMHKTGDFFGSKSRHFKNMIQGRMTQMKERMQDQKEQMQDEMNIPEKAMG